jgi:O-antigen ligase
MLDKLAEVLAQPAEADAPDGPPGAGSPDEEPRLDRGARGEQTRHVNPPERRRFAPPAAAAAAGAPVLALALLDGGSDPITFDVALIALLWGLVIVLAFVRRVRLSALEVAALCGFGGLLIWTGTSALWSLDRGHSVLDFERGLVTFTALAALLLLARTHTVVGLLAGVAGACVLVCGVAVAVWRDGAAASEPLGYANALGLMAAIGVVVTAGLVAAAPTRCARLVAAVSLPPAAAALYLSASRGALVAVAVALAAQLALSSGPRRAMATACVVAALAGVVAVPSPGAHAASARPDTAGSVALTPRLHYWSVALQAAADAPVLGTGAGSFERVWLLRRPDANRVHNAHNLYLETLTELGVVGFGLLLVALAPPLVAAARVRTHPLAPAAVGGYVAFLTHAAIDVDWEMPALTTTAVLCGGALLVLARPAAVERRLHPAARTAAVAATLAVGAFAYTALMGNAALEHSQRAMSLWAFDEAAVQARSAARWAPWSGEPWRAVGDAAFAQGNVRLARSSFRRGVDVDPASWPLWRSLARVSHGASQRTAAARAAALNPLGRH